MRVHVVSAFVGLCAVVGTIVIAPAPAHAGPPPDDVVRTDGQVVRGRIVAETADAVVVEVTAAGMSMRQRLPRARVRKVHRESRAGPGYCVVPVEGELGVAVTATALRDALAATRDAGAAYAVLAIDSDGGDRIASDELAQVIAAASAAGEVRVVAMVRRATGAAAVVAVACPEIYLLPGARLAADVPPGKATASMHRSIRIAARTAGHHPDWVAGVLGAEGARPTGLTAPTTQPADQREPRPCVVRQLEPAPGTTPGPDADLMMLRDAMGLAAWHEPDDRSRAVMAYAAGAEARARAQWKRREAERERQREARRRAAEEAARIAEAESRLTLPDPVGESDLPPSH